ncbi:MAG: FAD/NAD(P)-binding protein [Bacillota bacterium]
MLTQHDLPRQADPLRPLPARLVASEALAPDHRQFQFRFVDQELSRDWSHRPGQFVMLSVLGTGEAPISISSSPTRGGVIELCVRKAGRVTSALYRLKENAIVGLRGPFGNGFPIDQMKGNDVVVIAGGLGMAPLRSLLWHMLDNRDDFGHLALLYGTRTPEDMLFKQEVTGLVERADIDTYLTTDKVPEGQAWSHDVGVVTKLFPHVKSRIDPDNAYAAVCGPPVMYKFVLRELLDMGFGKDRILMSLERRMKCGIGKCSHCGVGYKYTCIHGPIFTYWDAMNLPEMV